LTGNFSSVFEGFLELALVGWVAVTTFVSEDLVLVATLLLDFADAISTSLVGDLNDWFLVA